MMNEQSHSKSINHQRQQSQQNQQQQSLPSKPLVNFRSSFYPTSSAPSTPTANLTLMNSMNGVNTNNNKSSNKLNDLMNNNLSCFSCLRSFSSNSTNGNFNSNQMMAFNDHYYHRDCLKCSKCEKHLSNENLSIENRHLVCTICSTSKRNRQSHLNSSPIVNSPCINGVESNEMNALPANNLNELKSKFETKAVRSEHYVLASFASNSSTSLSPSTTTSSWSSSTSSSNNNATSTHLNSLKFNLSNSNNSSHLTSKITNHQTESDSHLALDQTDNLVSNSIKTTSNIVKRLISETNNKSDIASNGLANMNRKSMPNQSQSKSKTSSATTTENFAHKDNNWVPIKHHTAKCSIMLRKMRRGGKRSKSLPAKFTIDSLLDYLNCSMILNKYEIKKLNQQRQNILMNSSNQNLVGNQSSRQIGSYYRNINNHHHHHHHQFSSGYNSENHSNSSNSTTATVSASNANTNTKSLSNQNNILNFFRLNLNHLPLNIPTTQCTCGAANVKTNKMSSSLLNNQKLPLHASSPILLKKNQVEDEEDEEDDDDEDEDDEDEDLDEDEDDIDEDLDDLDEDLDRNLVVSELPVIYVETDSAVNQITSPTNQASAANKQIKSPVVANKNFVNMNKQLTVNRASTENLKFLSSSLVASYNPPNSTFRRAPGTSHCQHTAKVDIRRVRSCRDLSHMQMTFSPDDFIFKEKLGEGFFATVKKIVSKHTNQEMVLKELKLNCITTTSNSNQDLHAANADGANGDDSQNSPKLDLLVNYAELNAAHKSFLKEAQVLRNLNHPNVIKFMGIMFTKEKHLNLILEYISGGTLKDIIHNIANVLPWKLRVGFAKDIAAAMEYLHSLNIIHRDLKSDNCLVRENGRSTVVVADFGLSRIINTNYSANSSSISGPGANGFKKAYNNNNSSIFFHHHQTNHLNSSTANLENHNQSPQSSSSATNSFIVAAKRKLKRRGYNHPQRKQRYAVVGNSFSMAPEMLKHQIYDERVDIFSFGIICCEIIGRVQADPDYLPRTSDFGLNVELFRKKYCEADCPKHFIKIAIACCELEPEKRPPFSKTHLWLDTILSHLEANNPIPKNLLKNILDQNTNKRAISTNMTNEACAMQQQPSTAK